MSKGKLKKFAEMETLKNVLQYPYGVISEAPFEMRGHWREQYFHNDDPVVLELGCGKGEYIIGLARVYPNINFIGVDIKGARTYTGAKQVLGEGLDNVTFSYTSIGIIGRFFSGDEVQEIWLTFSDPQIKNVRKRLTSTFFTNRYRRFLIDGGIAHLRTDSNFLFAYTIYMVNVNHLPVLFRTEDLYGNELSEERAAENQMNEKTCRTLGIHTYYEDQRIERGSNIKYMKFQLSREDELVELDVEIELDDYRSFKHTRRSGLTASKQHCSDVCVVETYIYEF